MARLIAEMSIFGTRAAGLVRPAIYIVIGQASEALNSDDIPRDALLSIGGVLFVTNFGVHHLVLAMQ
jgi:hypothetical protein